mgnify:CR=1 FL=1
MDLMVNYGIHVNYVDIQKDINLIYIYKYIMYKIFFPILISGVGIYYYYHFKYLNNNQEIKEEDEIIEDEIIEDEIIEDELNNLEENDTLNDMQRYQIILYKEPFTIFNNWEFIN